MKPGMLPKETEDFVARARARKPSAEEEQRARAFVYANLVVEDPRITREQVDAVLDAKRRP